MSHGHTRIPSKGMCVYCMRNDVRLTDEHIVPYSLGGQHVLVDASCLKCADITKKFEQDVARGLWGDVRLSYDGPSRRKKSRPKHITLPVAAPNITGLTVPFAEYPAPIVFYRMGKAGFLKGLRVEDDHTGNWKLVAVSDEIRLKNFLDKYPGELTAKFKHVPESFARLLLKIGYCNVLGSLEIQDFNPACLPYILGTSRNYSFMVGSGAEDEQPIPETGYAIKSHVFWCPERAVIMSEIRLYSNILSPSYHVVVGDAKGEEKVRNIIRKLKYTYGIQMPDRFATRRIPPESMHWMPEIWPLIDL